MKKASLADAKAHLSKLVDDAEHRGKRILILRHGKPAAAIVPVSAVQPPKVPRRRVTGAKARKRVLAYVAEFSAAEPEVSSVEELIRGRR